MPRQKSTHVDSAQAVGARIREARTRAGLRQRDLSFPGCTVAYISRIESGARIPSLQLLREIGKRLGVSADFLATGADAPTEKLALTDAQLAFRLGDLATARQDFGRLAESSDGVVRRGALLGLGELALLDGETDRAIEFLEEHDRLGLDQHVEPAAVEALVHAYLTRGERPAALALLERKLEQTAADPPCSFRLSVLYANALIDLGELDRAEVALAEPVKALGSSPDPIAFARCLWSQSRLQTARGSNDLAASYAEQALAIIKGTEHEEYAARAHHLLAYIELERGNPSRALDLLEEARPLVERSADRAALALFQLERARALAALERHAEALAIARELIRESEHLSPVDAARALAIIAGIHADAGESEQALELFEAAANALADVDNAPMLVALYTRWSELLEQSGDTQAALTVARRALAARSSVSR